MFSPERRALSPLGAASVEPVDNSSSRTPSLASRCRCTVHAPLLRRPRDRTYDVLGVLHVTVGRREPAAVFDPPLARR